MPVAHIKETMRFVFFVFASTCLMSCLVTDSIDNVQPVNFPSSVVSTPDAFYPLNKIVEVDSDEMLEELEFDVIIRDANVKEQLEIQVFVIREDGSSSDVLQQLNNTIPPTMTESVERSTTIRVPVANLGDPGCVKIELLVSQQFLSRRMPVDEGDVHSSVWWVALTAPDGAAIDMRDCPE